MATATYHGGKLYLPKRVRQELGLSDGDRMEITSRDGKIIASPIRAEDPEELLIRMLDEPLERTKPIGIPVSPPWRRRDIYGAHRR